MIRKQFLIRLLVILMLFSIFVYFNKKRKQKFTIGSQVNTNTSQTIPNSNSLQRAIQRRNNQRRTGTAVDEQLSRAFGTTHNTNNNTEESTAEIIMSEFKQFQEILSKDDDDEIHFCNSSMNCGDADYNVTGVVDSFFEDEGDKPSNYCLDYAIQLDTGENLNEDDPNFIDRTGNITIGNQLFRREHPAYERMTGICIPNKAVTDIENTEQQQEFNKIFETFNESKKGISTIFYILDDFISMYPNSHILNKAFFAKQKIELNKVDIILLNQFNDEQLETAMEQLDNLRIIIESHITENLLSYLREVIIVLRGLTENVSEEKRIDFDSRLRNTELDIYSQKIYPNSIIRDDIIRGQIVDFEIIDIYDKIKIYTPENSEDIGLIDTAIQVKNFLQKFLSDNIEDVKIELVTSTSSVSDTNRLQELMDILNEEVLIVKQLRNELQSIKEFNIPKLFAEYDENMVNLVDTFFDYAGKYSTLVGLFGVGGGGAAVAGAKKVSFLKKKYRIKLDEFATRESMKATLAVKKIQEDVAVQYLVKSKEIERNFSYEINQLDEMKRLNEKEANLERQKRDTSTNSPDFERLSEELRIVRTQINTEKKTNPIILQLKRRQDAKLDDLLKGLQSKDLEERAKLSKEYTNVDGIVKILAKKNKSSEDITKWIASKYLGSSGAKTTIGGKMLGPKWLDTGKITESKLIGLGGIVGLDASATFDEADGSKGMFNTQGKGDPQRMRQAIIDEAKQLDSKMIQLSSGVLENGEFYSAEHLEEEVQKMQGGRTIASQSILTELKSLEDEKISLIQQIKAIKAIVSVLHNPAAQAKVNELETDISIIESRQRDLEGKRDGADRTAIIARQIAELKLGGIKLKTELDKLSNTDPEFEEKSKRMKDIDEKIEELKSIEDRLFKEEQAEKLERSLIGVITEDRQTERDRLSAKQQSESRLENEIIKQVKYLEDFNKMDELTKERTQLENQVKILPKTDPIFTEKRLELDKVRDDIKILEASNPGLKRAVFEKRETVRQKDIDTMAKLRIDRDSSNGNREEATNLNEQISKLNVLYEGNKDFKNKTNKAIENIGLTIGTGQIRGGLNAGKLFLSTTETIESTRLKTNTELQKLKRDLIKSGISKKEQKTIDKQIKKLEKQKRKLLDSEIEAEEERIKRLQKYSGNNSSLTFEQTRIEKKKLDELKSERNQSSAVSSRRAWNVEPSNKKLRNGESSNGESSNRGTTRSAFINAAKQIFTASESDRSLEAKKELKRQANQNNQQQTVPYTMGERAEVLRSKTKVKKGKKKRQ